MEQIRLRVYKLGELKGDAAKRAKADLEMLYGDIPLKAKTVFRYLYNGALLKGDDGLSHDMCAVLGETTSFEDRYVQINNFLEELSDLEEGTVVDTILDGREYDFIDIVGKDRILDRREELLRVLDLDMEIMEPDPFTPQTDIDFKDILLGLWANRENIKFNKKVEGLRAFLNI